MNQEIADLEAKLKRIRLLIIPTFLLLFITDYGWIVALTALTVIGIWQGYYVKRIKMLKKHRIER